MKYIVCLLVILLSISCQLEEEVNTIYKDQPLQGTLTKESWSFVSGYAEKWVNNAIEINLFDFFHDLGTNKFDEVNYRQCYQYVTITSIPVDNIVGKHDISAYLGGVNGSGGGYASDGPIGGHYRIGG